MSKLIFTYWTFLAWWSMNVTHAKAIWAWANTDVKRITKDTVGGGWSVETLNGTVFTFGTLKKAVEEAWLSR